LALSQMRQTDSTEFWWLSTSSPSGLRSSLLPALRLKSPRLLRWNRTSLWVPQSHYHRPGFKFQ
jgi:hypothetical protein